MKRFSNAKSFDETAGMPAPEIIVENPVLPVIPRIGNVSKLRRPDVLTCLT